MSAFLGDPALRLLARRKLRASVRSFRRRLRTPKGAFFTLCGVALFLLWMTSLFLPSVQGGRWVADPEDLRGGVRVGALILVLISLSSSLSHRGLYMPADEIQRLFSAPVSRRDLVRYRLITTMSRGMFGAVIVGIVLMRRMPVPVFAFLGAACAIMTLPILGQLAALLSGGLEARWAKRLGRTRGLFLLLAIGVLFLLMADFPSTPGVRHELLSGLDRFRPSALMDIPWVAAITSPFVPWAQMVTAYTWPAFLPWFVMSVLLALALFELTVRLPVDYRELSMDTSASVAARVRRVRRGGGVAASKASKSLAGFRVPWLFGRSPAGALAWRKASSILRKAKGTIWVSVLVLLILTVVGRSSENGMPLIAVLGTFYLASGLRFDFRDDLERMEVIKAWPISPAKAFAATLLPEVLLVAVLVMGALLVHALAVGSFSSLFWAVLLLQPPFVFAWVAVDNAVFLLAPVRFVPGQEGALQNAGRGMMLMFFRALVLLVVTALCAGPAALIWFLGGSWFGLSQDVLFVVSAAAAGVVLCACDLLLVWAGGKCLKRFDVASDRG